MENTAIKAYKQVLNEKTDAGEYTKSIAWKVSQRLADLLGDGIHEGDNLIWDPKTRELISYRGRER